MSTYIELEIQTLLNEVEDLGEVGARLIHTLESSLSALTLENINALALFLLQSNNSLKLIEFILRYIENDHFPIPWPYFWKLWGGSVLSWMNARSAL